LEGTTTHENVPETKIFEGVFLPVFWMVFWGMLDILLKPPITMLAIGILLQVGYVIQELILKLREKASK
jgi:hypothetical protein